MAYSPLDQGRLLKHAALKYIGNKHAATAAQVALAWLLSFDDVCVIPKSARIEGVDEILGAVQVRFDDEDRAALQQAFPPPRANARMQTT